MTIRIPDEIPILRLAVFAWQNGCDLYATRTGGIEFRPRNVAVATNCRRIKVPGAARRGPGWAGPPQR